MVTGKDLSLFTLHLYYMVKAGSPLPDALKNISCEMQNNQFKQALLDIEEQSEQGKSLQSALSSYPNIFPLYYTKMISAAEESGFLPQALEELSAFLEKTEQALKDLRSAALYPSLILNLTLIFIWVVLTQTAPVIRGVIENTPASGSFFAVLLMNGFNLIYSRGFILSFFFLILVVDFAVFFNHNRANALMFKVPFFNSLIKKAYLIRIARAMGFMLNMNMTLDETLEQIIKIVDCKDISRSLKGILQKVQAGEALSEALKGEKFFQGTFLSFVQAGENKEDLPVTLMKAADHYERELEWQTSGLMKFIEPALILAAGAIVGLMTASLFYPLYLTPWEIA